MRVMVGAVVAFALFAGCSGGVGDSCRNAGDCGSGLYCRGPDDPPRCGIGPQQQCASDTDCFGAVCHAVSDTCSADGIGSACGTSCAGFTCPDGFTCNAGGACEPTRCDAGYACAAWQACDPAAAAASGAVYDLTHGCVSIACSHDSGCPAGTVCTNSVCQSGSGSCQDAAPVP
jgi:hypothetical protein